MVSRKLAKERTYVGNGVQPYAIDPDCARALWMKSKAMVGERFQLPPVTSVSLIPKHVASCEAGLHAEHWTLARHSR